MWESKIDKMTFYGAKNVKIWLYYCGCYYVMLDANFTWDPLFANVEYMWETNVW